MSSADYQFGFLRDQSENTPDPALVAPWTVESFPGAEESYETEAGIFLLAVDRIAHPDTSWWSAWVQFDGDDEYQATCNAKTAAEAARAASTEARDWLVRLRGEHVTETDYARTAAALIAAERGIPK